MRVLRIAIWAYIFGLLVFYLYAIFDSHTWDIAYFGWSKLCDCGLLFWWYIYLTANTSSKKIVRWLFYFSIARFIGDIQSFFTGIGVNNEIVVSVLYFILLIVVLILVFKEDDSFGKWGNKYIKQPLIGLWVIFKRILKKRK